MATCRFESIEICAQFVSHKRLWDAERHADSQGYEDARRLPWVQCKRFKKVLLRLSIDPEWCADVSDAEPPTRLAAPPPAPVAVIFNFPMFPRPRPVVASSMLMNKASLSVALAKLRIPSRTLPPTRLAPPPTSPMARNVSSGAPTSPSRSPPSRSASFSATSSAVTACVWTKSLLLPVRVRSWCTWT